MPLKLMYLFDPGVELSCLCNFLSLHCRMDTIENILRTAIKKKISSKGQKTWLPSRCCHACLGLSSACGPGPCKAEGWRGDADISRQAWLLRRSSRSTAACSGGLPPYLGAVWGTWGRRGSAPRHACLVKAVSLGIWAASAAGLVVPEEREGKLDLRPCRTHFAIAVLYYTGLR